VEACCVFTVRILYYGNDNTQHHYSNDEGKIFSHKKVFFLVLLIMIVTKKPLVRVKSATALECRLSCDLLG
jgi:hypothetical protein